MPHLHFDLNLSPPDDAKRHFGAAVVSRFAEIMDTGTDHIGVTLRCHGPHDLVFGRAVDPSAGIAFVNADIRLGRTVEQKRRLALAFIDEVHRAFGIPRQAVYVIYTEHDGEHFQLVEKVLPTWSPGEDPLART
jgi:phenylpyruvate tautomerase PptA (4-oxalocrotonate tautomerase family)